MARSRDSATSGRFGRLVERRVGADFPFYDGRPVAIPAWQWAVVWGACLVAFLVLTPRAAGGRRSSGGSARLILTLAYIRTKNLWVSTGAHVLDDAFAHSTAPTFLA